MCHPVLPQGTEEALEHAGIPGSTLRRFSGFSVRNGEDDVVSHDLIWVRVGLFRHHLCQWYTYFDIFVWASLSLPVSAIVRTVGEDGIILGVIRPGPSRFVGATAVGKRVSGM